MAQNDITMQEEMDAKAVAAAAKRATTTKRKNMTLKQRLLLLIISIVLMGVLRTGFMFVIIGLLPSIVAYYMDVTAERHSFKTIFACNLAGLMPFIGKMLHQGPSSALLQEIMGSGLNWVMIYGAAFFGWLLIELCPMIAQVMVSSFNQTQVSRIERLQKKIECEWGSEVTQLNNPDYPRD